MADAATAIRRPSGAAPAPARPVVRRPVERRAAEPSGAAPSNKALLVVIGILCGLAVLAGVGTFAAFSSGLVTTAKASNVPGKAAPNYAALPTMNFTLVDGKLMRRLRLKVLLELDPAIKPGVIDRHTPRIVSALNTRMSGMQPTDIVGPGGTRMVKDAVAVIANAELEPIRVRQVLVQEMLMN